MIDDDKSSPAEGESKESAGGAAASGPGSSGEDPMVKSTDAASRPACFWRRPRTRTVLLCGGFLVIGLGLGSIVTGAAIRRIIRHGLRDPGRFASKVLSHMRRDLDLTDEQAAEILPILQKRFTGLRDAIRREHEAIAGDIEPVLTPEQRVIHKRMLEERRERFLGKGSQKEDPK